MKCFLNTISCAVILAAGITSCGGGSNSSDNKPSTTSPQIAAIDASGIYQGYLTSKSSGTIDLDCCIILPSGEFMLHSNPSIVNYPNMLLDGTFQISNNQFSNTGKAYSCTGSNFPSGNNIEAWATSSGEISQAGTQVHLNSNYTSAVPDTGTLCLYRVQTLSDSSKTIKNLSGRWIASATSTIGYTAITVSESGSISGDLTGDISTISSGSNGFRLNLNHSGQIFQGLGFGVDATDKNQFFYMLTNNSTGQLSIGLYRPAPVPSYPYSTTAIVGTDFSLVPTNTGGPITHATIRSGILPSGLSLNNDGSVTGIPNTIGSYYFSIATWNATGSGGEIHMNIIIKQ